MLLGWRAGTTRMRIWTAALALGSFMFAQWMTPAHAAGAFYSLPTRAWEILIGASAAMLLPQPPAADWTRKIAETLSLSGIALLITAVVVFDEGTAFPGVGVDPLWWTG